MSTDLARAEEPGNRQPPGKARIHVTYSPFEQILVAAVVVPDGRVDMEPGVHKCKPPLHTLPFPAHSAGAKFDPPPPQ